MTERELSEIEAELKRHTYGSCGGNACEGAEYEVGALITEVRRLRWLVEAAFDEGYRCGVEAALDEGHLCGHEAKPKGEAWQESATRRTLDKGAA